MLVFMLGLTGCSKKEPAVESSVDFGELESTSEVETTKDIFAVADPNIKGYEIRETTVASHETEESKEPVEEYDPYAEVDRSSLGLTDEELAEIEDVDRDTFTDPVTGELVNVSDYLSLTHMQIEARDVWKEAYKSGEVSKEDIESYINDVYSIVPEAERQKVIDEILSDDKEVEVYPTEAVEDETFSDEELEEVIKALEEAGMVVNQDGIDTTDATGWGYDVPENRPSIGSN